MIGLAGFGDCPALRLVRGGHVWPSLCKYLGHLFVVRKASSDQHATAPVTSARGSGNRADTYWATFRCDSPTSAATLFVREFGSDSVAARSLAFADRAYDGSCLRLRNPHARTSDGLTHIVWLGLACRSSFDVHRKWMPYTPACAPSVDRRGANAQGVPSGSIRPRIRRPLHQHRCSIRNQACDSTQAGSGTRTPSRSPNGTTYSWPRAANFLAKTLETWITFGCSGALPQYPVSKRPFPGFSVSNDLVHCRTVKHKSYRTTVFDLSHILRVEKVNNAQKAGVSGFTSVLTVSNCCWFPHRFHRE